VIQYWQKSGLLIDGNDLPGYSYAAVPTILFKQKNILRVAFSRRDSQNRSLPFYFDFDINNQTVIHISQIPLLMPGNMGCFDDSGVMPTCAVERNNEIWMYYIGWNLGVTVPFRNSLGLAISKDGGTSFYRAFEGPVVDRTALEPHFNASCSIMRDRQKWKMWYLSCIKWVKTDTRYEHYYHLKYAESKNGVNWKRNGQVAVDFKYPGEHCISAPRVIKENGVFKMWYSYRKGFLGDTYRIGYAESLNGINWERKDENVKLDISAKGWDSEMICYPCIFEAGDKLYMFYNGNGYGQSGIGLAVLNK
jgi:hypothetical protein